MSDIYIKTGINGKVARTMKFTRGGIMVMLDFNQHREVVGVEVLSAASFAVDGHDYVPIQGAKS